MDTLITRFAARLNNLRAERNMSQNELASRARLDPSFISALERARKTPSLTTLEQLAHGLGIELSMLVEFPEQRRKADRSQEEIELLVSLLRGRDPQTIRRIRKAVAQLLA